MHIVFLQGMPSPFFSRIGAALEQLGCTVTGINFCLGDQIFWKGKRKVNYRGTLKDWPKFIAEFIEREKVTDLVLLGEQRDYHKQAVAIAKEKNIRVTVTDFGYLRPDWITLELDGMGGDSRFPKDPETVKKIAANAPKADLAIKYHGSILNMAKGDLLYSFSSALFCFLYPHYRQSYRRAHPFIYFPAIGLRLLLAKARHKKACEFMQNLVANETRYFVFPLQLKHDFQIIAYSPFERIEDALRLVIKSFAENAAKDVHLLFKIHPWDPGFTNWRKKLSELAQEYGVKGRIGYIEGGKLAEIIKSSLGMVTINSTSAIQALQLRCPVLSLGQAVYNIPGLVYQNGIDKFWNDATPPDSQLVDDFINALAATIQIRGEFFTEPGLSKAVEEATHRIYEKKTGEML